MNRTARRTVRRQMLRTLRERRAAAKALATGWPVSARTFLLTVGLSADDAKRYAGAFSRGVLPIIVVDKVVKTGRRRRLVPVKLYDLTTLRHRLEVYRPRERAAHDRFRSVAAGIETAAIAA